MKNSFFVGELMLQAKLKSKLFNGTNVMLNISVYNSQHNDNFRMLKI